MFISTLTVSPPNPRPFDNVVITAAGPLGCFGSEQLVMTQSGFVFTGHIDFSPICFTTPPPLLTSFVAGHLAPGTYTVTVDETHDGGVQFVPRVTTTTTFSVSADGFAIPTLDPIAIVLVAVAILFVAIPRLFRR